MGLGLGVGVRVGVGVHADLMSWQGGSGGRSLAMLEASEMELAREEASEEASEMELAREEAMLEASEIELAREEAMLEASELELAREEALDAVDVVGGTTGGPSRQRVICSLTSHSPFHVAGAAWRGGKNGPQHALGMPAGPLI